MRWSKPLDISNATDRCPRCSGNLSKEFDALGGWDAACLQCGFRGPPPAPEPAQKPRSRKRPAQRRHAAKKHPRGATRSKGPSRSRAPQRRS